jgi:hypothetical protein
MARMRQVNVDGVIHTVRAVAPGMKERGYGRISYLAAAHWNRRRRVGNRGPALVSPPWLEVRPTHRWSEPDSNRQY